MFEVNEQEPCTKSCGMHQGRNWLYQKKMVLLRNDSVHFCSIYLFPMIYLFFTFINKVVIKNYVEYSTNFASSLVILTQQFDLLFNLFSSFKTSSLLVVLNKYYNFLDICWGNSRFM